METRQRMAAILLLSTTLFSVFVSGCGVDDVAVYNVKLLFKSDKTFPEATATKTRWSQVFGQSHNRTYALYRIGEVASPNVRSFATSGSPRQLMEEGKENSKVYDQFTMPSVEEEGETESMVFLDGEHSLVSMICLMKSSPDWFIGVDSLNLCVDFSWVDQITLDLEILDAGVVDGSTSDPRNVWSSGYSKPVQRIPLHNPEYPGSSFFYRKTRQTPSIAKVEFTKVKKYTTKELNDLARKELTSKLIQKDQKGLPTKAHYDEYSYETYDEQVIAKKKMDELKDLEEDPVGTPKPDIPKNKVTVVTRAPAEINQESVGELKNMDDVVLAVANGKHLGLGKHLPRHFRSRLHHAVNRDHVTSRDCEVSKWSKWSGCLECGSGDDVRTRSIVRRVKRGGKKCPSLIETKPCRPCRGDGFEDE